jgi:hypothetical protein
MGCFRKIHSGELRNLYASQNIMVITSRRMGCAGHVERMEEMRNACEMVKIRLSLC